jgi:putative addiction module component (TIGR02574 family)
MTETLEQLKTQLTLLSNPERAELAHFLLASLEPEEEGAAEAWDAEVKQRVQEILSGRALGKPADQFFGELREQYP